jgi:hypothetical protein
MNADKKQPALSSLTALANQPASRGGLIAAAQPPKKICVHLCSSAVKLI